MATHLLNSSLLLCLVLLSTTCALNPSSSTTSLQTHVSFITSLCKSTPYPDACFHALELSIDINITPNILNYLLNSLQSALTEANKISYLFSDGGYTNIVEKQKGTIQDCQQLHQITLSALKKSVAKINSIGSRNLADAKTFLSASLTNKVTCLEGLDSAYGSSKPLVLSSLDNAYKYVSNALSILSKTGVPKGRKNRRLMAAPRWLSRKDRRILQTSGDEYDPNEVLTVAADGSGNFSTITDAINFAPNNSYDRIIVYVKEGVYQENVEIPSWKPNIVLLGDGSDVTIITGNRNVADGWTTFRSATVAVSGEGFLARDITFENSAGPEKHQAVALRINADLAAVYRCNIDGYQDTLYVHSYRQFYRECNISGTIDFIFGNAAVVFQGCNIISRMPMPGQGTVITAQSRETPDETTGISIQNCSILATDELYGNANIVTSTLGRPWRNYSRTVYIESYIDDFIAPEGWSKWSGDQGLETLYYGEFENNGPGSDTQKRVDWPGYHVMDYDEASEFTVSEFITGEEWLDSTSFPYYDGV